MERRAYKIKPVVINKVEVNEVVIDPHIDKHSDHISDKLVLELVATLDSSQNIPDEYDGGFQYFVSEISFEAKLYNRDRRLE
jgi:hypothetical protein